MGRLLRTLLLAAVCASPLSAQDISDRDQRVGQVLLNVTHLRDLEAPDERTALGYKRACADDTGNTYCHQVRNLTDEGGRKHAWSLRVAYSPGGWEASEGPEPVETDPNGSEFFALPSRDAKQGTTRVAARLTVGDLRLTLQDSRSGDLAQGEHLRLMKNRWSFLLEQAVKHGLIEQSDEPRIYVSLDETEWFGAARELVDGDVVSVDEDLAHWAVFRLSVFVEPPPLAEGETEYVIDMDLDAEGLRETRITYADGKPVHFRASVDTYQIVVDTERAPAAELLVRFKPLVLTADSPLGQKAVLSFSAQTVKVGTTITLHRTTWFPTLRRFELDQEYLLRDPGQEGRPPTVSPDVKADPMLDQAWRFNSARIAAADAVGAWRQLAPLVAIRPGVDEDSPGGRAPGPRSPVFRPDEPVVLGFKLDERVGAGYWHAENVAGAEHTMTPWVESVPQKVYVDLWLDRDPEPPRTTWADVIQGLEDEFEELFGPEP
ncbi:MAG: hypothetical protein O2816_13710, partial [Planctomycetota bacterium]|nr:hypothetical protein [Planctomycetota bacterium]